MRNAVVFGEDYAHEVVLRTLLQRLATEYDVSLQIHVRSATRGHGRLLSELAEFAAELKRGRQVLPDLFVAARDANCRGYGKRVQEIAETVQDYQGFLVPAVPDPHVERWLLIDPKAFRQVLGQGCRTPDQKCDRDRYKQLLDDAVRATGIQPLLGGVEFAEDIVRAMNLHRASKADTSFAHLLRDLRAVFQRWKPA